MDWKLSDDLLKREAPLLLVTGALDKGTLSAARATATAFETENNRPCPAKFGSPS